MLLLLQLGVGHVLITC